MTFIMKKLSFIEKFIDENKGSTLITVIVAIGFVTILTSIILGSSLTNYRMKAIDRRAKDDFYYTEKAVNDIYTGIGQEIAVIAANAYDDAFSRVGLKVSDGVGGYIDVATAQKAEAYYKQKYFTDVVAWATANAKASKFQSYIVDTSAEEKESYVMSVGGFVVEDIAEAPVTDPTKYGTHAVDVRIRDINVICADKNKDYKGEITTDIVISIPMMGFFDNNVDVVDYAIIANEGIDIDGTGGLTVEDGNVYAGLSQTGSDVSGGININSGDMDFEGNYLISKGDITVGSTGKPASFKAGLSRPTRSNIWFDSIITHEDAVTPSIDVNANTFALNDIELNALGSYARFKGTYYGYDEGFLDPSASFESDVTGGMLIDKGKKHSDSSAIIINGAQSTLDMRDLSTLMLMGKAYIEAGDKEISTAEAMALRTNQQLYLVPPDFLDCPNPAAGEKTEAQWNCNINPHWFGYKYLKIESGKPKINMLQIGTGSTAVSYAFLEFDDSGDYDLTSLGGSAHNKARSAFLYEILNGVDTVAPGESSPVQPTQSQLKNRISNSLSNYDSFRLQECIVDDSGDANIYSVNALAKYVVVDRDASGNIVVNGYSGIDDSNRIGSVSEIVAVSNTAAMDRYLGYPQNLFRRYQWLCTMLNANEDVPLSHNIPAVDTSGRGLRKIDQNPAWKAQSDYPYKYYVHDGSYTETADAAKIPVTSYGQCIYGAHPILNSNFNGVCISTGDIEVNSGVEVHGLLIAKKKIIFHGGNTVKSDRALLQKRIAKELELNKENGEYYSDYIISYLDNGAGALLYGTTTPGGTNPKTDEARTDYTEYLFFENWKKGGR